MHTSSGCVSASKGNIYFIKSNDNYNILIVHSSKTLSLDMQLSEIHNTFMQTQIRNLLHSLVLKMHMLTKKRNLLHKNVFKTHM